MTRYGITSWALAVSMLTATAADARRARVDDSGPDLPYSCPVVRGYAALKGFSNPPTREQRKRISTLEKENGITPKQHRQAAACFKTK